MTFCLSLAVGPRLNTDAAKRFVRNALWEAEEQQREGGEPQGKEKALNNTESGGASTSDADSSRKRKLDTSEETISISDSTKRTCL